MKAMIETREPAIRPATQPKLATRPVGAPRRFGFQPMTAPVPFHAWRA